MNHPLERLRYHVTGAIERGEASAIVEKPVLATPNNSADCVVTLQISGNRLVSVLNALDQLAYEAGKYRLKGNDTISDMPWWHELRQTTEAIRDELSKQRCEARKS